MDNVLLHVDIIIFTDGNRERNRTCYIWHDRFLIVKGETEDSKPSWYNLNEISTLIGVVTEKIERIDQDKRNSQIFFFH